MNLPTIPIGTLQVSRLIVGGNPFSGISHQTPDRDQEMRAWYTSDRIKATLADCEALGVNTAVLRADAHIWRLLEEYWNEGGKIQWFAQTAPEYVSQEASIDRAIAGGATGCYLQGGIVDELYHTGNLARISALVDRIKRQGVATGIASHQPEVHLALHKLALPLDFHMVCFYDCGSVHRGEGDKFRPEDPPLAVDAIRQITTPCLAYKIFAAGRRDPQEALHYAFANIKPTDAVVMGLHTKDAPQMVADNVAVAREAMQA